MIEKKKLLTRGIAIGTVLTVGVALASCSNTSSEPSAESTTSADGECVIADDITIGMVNEQSGPVAYVGVGALEGAEVALEQINSSGYLGDGVELSLKTVDTGGEIERASSEMTQMLNDDSVPVIIGPAASQSATSVAPMVESSQVPTVFTQAGSEGVVIGDWTFRASPPMETYFSLGVEWLAAEGFENISVIYNGTFPTFAQLGETHVPEDAAAEGITIMSSQAVQMTTQDFNSQAQVIASENPEAVVMMLTPSQAITFTSQLRDAGYEGQIMGTPSLSGGMLADGGSSVDGVVYPVAFSPVFESAKVEEFVGLFEDEFQKLPNNYNGEGYDALWWIAHGIKESGCSTAEGIRDGLAAIGEKGFEGAQGNLTFENGNDARVDGGMVRWSSADAADSLVE